MYPLEQTLALWIRERITPVSRHKVMTEFMTFVKQVIKTFFHAHDAVIYHCFYKKSSANFVQLPSFTSGFIPVPQPYTNGAVRLGSLRTGMHLLSVCPCSVILFWLILEHMSLYIPRLFIDWVLSHSISHALITQLIQGGAHRVARVEYLMHGELEEFS